MSALKNLLEGKPARMPLHPALVHLPIALFPLSVLLDVGSWIFPHPEWQLVRASFVTLIGGIATAVLAALFGFVDFTEIRADHPAAKIATQHMILNLVAVALFAIGAVVRVGELDAAHTAILPLALSIVGLGLVGYSGYLGGDLVYNDGIGAGRHRRRTPTPESTIQVRSSDARVAVADDAALRDGETLRVDVDGTVVTIARVEGTLHAFQEFCTHRYGPLSEGHFAGCHVVCPWHGSRFDMRTGKVTGGPAKVDLRTFHVVSRDGKIWLERPSRS
jgi:nitrite reductase/ring-hydroxylating ferredoxin subunit/uncharacterized membrane protein